MSDSTDYEIIVFVDYIPNNIELGSTIAENMLKSAFNKSLHEKISRWGQLPVEAIQIRSFGPLFIQARTLYIEGYYEAAIALCGMTVEALCITIAEDRVVTDKLKVELIDPTNSNIRGKIRKLKKYLRVQKSASFFHQILDIQRKYLHIHERKINPENALECINLLHLAILAEYGLVPGIGKYRNAKISDVEERAKKMGIIL